MFIYVKEHKVVIKMIGMPQDGNCLFSAIYHQLNEVSHNSTVFSEEVQKLRESVVCFLKARLEEKDKHYINSVKNTMVDNEKLCFNDISLEDCKEYVKEKLKLSIKWGGAESIKAVSEMFNVNVLVLTEGAKKHSHYFDAKRNRTIILAYRLSPNAQSILKYYHYDSVLALNEVHLRELAQQMAEPIFIDIGNYY